MTIPQGDARRKNTLRFVFPMPPNRNAGQGSNVAWNQKKKKYYAQLDEMQNAGLLPPPPRLAIARAGITASVYIRNKMDDDNAMHRMKWPQDWLKKRGYIVDDRRPFLSWLNVPEQVCDRTGRDEAIIVKLVNLDTGE